MSVVSSESKDGSQSPDLGHTVRGVQHDRKRRKTHGDASSGSTGKKQLGTKDDDGHDDYDNEGQIIRVSDDEVDEAAQEAEKRDEGCTVTVEVPVTIAPSCTGYGVDILVRTLSTLSCLFVDCNSIFSF